MSSYLIESMLWEVSLLIGFLVFVFSVLVINSEISSSVARNYGEEGSGFDLSPWPLSRSGD